MKEKYSEWKVRERFTVSSNWEYLSVSLRNISHGETFIFSSLAIWRGEEESEWTCSSSEKQKKRMKHRYVETCDRPLVLVSSWQLLPFSFSFLLQSEKEENKKLQIRFILEMSRGDEHRAPSLVSSYCSFDNRRFLLLLLTFVFSSRSFSNVSLSTSFNTVGWPVTHHVVLIRV